MEQDLENMSADDMRLETKRFVLQALLEKAVSVLPSKEIQAVLTNFLIELSPEDASEDGSEYAHARLDLIATDLELAIVATTEMVRVDRPGRAVLPGRRLMELVKEADEGEVVIDVKDGVAHISIGRTVWDLHLMDGSSYPNLPRVAGDQAFTIEREPFVEALSVVRYAAATKTRPSLMLIEAAQGRLRAADGVRFQQVKVPGWPEGLTAQIPVTAVDDLLRLLRWTDQDAFKLSESENHLVFEIGPDTFVVTKLLAKFPDVSDMLLNPASRNDQVLSADRDALISAIKRVRVTADPDDRAVVLALSKGQIEVRSKDKFGNEAREPVEGSWERPARVLGFNHQHLLDLLDTVPPGTCSFLLGEDKKTKRSPIVFKAGARLGILNQVRVEHLA